MIELLLRSAARTLVLGRCVALVHGSAQAVKVNEEWLRKIGLDAPTLVVNVVVGGVIGENVVQWVVWELVAAVVEHCLDRGASEEPHRLAHCHTGKQVAKTAAECVESEAFKRMVVEGAISVWNVETVVARVEGYCSGQILLYKGGGSKHLP